MRLLFFDKTGTTPEILMRLVESDHGLIVLFEHDLFGKLGFQFPGSCSKGVGIACRDL
jgi:hypothetical protein